MAAPIWKDKYITLGSGDYYDYELRLDNASGTRIFSGRAYKRPGASNVEVRINDIVADYLTEVLPHLALAGFTAFANAVKVLTITGGTTKDTTTFYNDWSYDDGFNSGTMPLADPVRKDLDPRQHLLFSVLPGTASLTATLTYKNGTTASVVIQVAGSADFNDDFNDDFSTIDAADRGGCAVLDLSAYSGLASVTIGGVTYPVLDNGCHTYAVYYVNAYGGWDSLLLDGTTSRRDALTRHTTITDYDNTTTDRGRRDYAIEVAPCWSLRTGILTDDESSRMHHLLNSANVYLCELGTGKMYPVVLTDTESAHQSYKSNGRRPNDYTFNAQLAQERYRR